MIEQLARASAEDLRATTVSDVEADLVDLYGRLRRRQRRTRLGLVAATVVSVGLAAIGGAVLTHRDDHSLLPTHPKPNQSHAVAYCPTDMPVTCLPHHTYRFPLVRAVTWRIPPGFVFRSRQPRSPWLVESYRVDGHPGESGVTVMERARASAPDGDGPAVGMSDSPRALVHWIAQRPFLSVGPVRKTLIDGHPAWQVRVALAPDMPPGPASWNRSKCYAVVYQPVAGGDRSCLYGNIVSRYTAFTLPTVGTTVVWAWSVGEDPGLARLDDLIHGLSWKPR